jgi:hypothetical protein
MTSLRNNAPRRYFVDAMGRRVLIGLTLEETFEFERLDSKPGLDQAGGQAPRGEEVLWPTGEQRWLELYEKHDGAWRAWMAQSRAETTGGFNFY